MRHCSANTSCVLLLTLCIARCAKLPRAEEGEDVAAYKNDELRENNGLAGRTLMYSSARGNEDRQKYFLHRDNHAAFREDGNYECPYVIHSEEEALARADDTSIPGNTITVENLRFCRTGNHFSTAFRHLAMGYCCKSKLVTLPPKDDILAPGVFNEGTPGPRWFDFSSAPSVPGFDPSTCKDISWGGASAFHLIGLNNRALEKCMHSIDRMVGCESTYFFPRDVEVCPKREPVDGPGHLAVHVRSGDIFEMDSPPTYYGQPPLTYYVNVIKSKPWSSVEIVTYFDNPKGRNPNIVALQEMVDSGELQGNITIHTHREFADDLRTMMCADALVNAGSTLVCLTSYHTSARRVYNYDTCSPVLKQLKKARKGMKVYGVQWKPDAPVYQVKQYWNHSDEQLREMVAYDGVEKPIICH